MPGKAMIVCMSREICVDMYDAIVAIRPDWHDADPDKGAIKIVMTGSASDKTCSRTSTTKKPKNYSKNVSKMLMIHCRL
jgi:type I restriction enzyme R subunit